MGHIKKDPIYNDHMMYSKVIIVDIRTSGLSHSFIQHFSISIYVLGGHYTELLFPPLPHLELLKEKERVRNCFGNYKIAQTHHCCY